MTTIGTFPFLVEPFKCDCNGRFTYSNLGNCLLNAADFHAAERQFGYNDLDAEGKAWVLSRLAIEMTEMPRPYDRLMISTWVESARHFFTRRNWAVKDCDGHVYGYASSVWAMIDKTTRQPVDVFSVNDGCMGDYVVADETVPIDSPSRVSMDEKEAKEVRTLKTTYSDIDVNGHVNSIRYIEHAIDCIPTDVICNRRIHRIEVAYVAESYLGDQLCFMLDRPSESEWAYMILRVLSDGDEREVCRVKVVLA